MAGHSKWANIQHRKGAQDHKRGKIFGKLIREISTAARSGADVAANPRLRLAVERARSASMPKETIERAIRRAGGGEGGESYASVRYEGYGPGGSAVMIDCLTDNRKRTVAEIRHAFARHGGNLGAEGSVAYLFKSVGLLTYPPGTDEEPLMAAALEAGAEDVVAHPDGAIEVLTDPAEFDGVRASLAAAGLTPAGAELTQRAAASVELRGEAAEAMVGLLETLEDLDDVQNVYSNAQIPDEVLARL